jgi:CDP-glucose 4,6-dehydratase
MDQVVKENLFGGFYKGRKVFITGHTGFKGSWLSILLHWLGSEVYGFALKPNTVPNLYELAEVNKLVSSTIGDIRDYNLLSEKLKEIQPEIIVHMAAQPLVGESYKNPRETYEINVMGTVNLLDAARQVPGIKVILNITSDKCYENRAGHQGYCEDEPMGGYDPYSNSKGCSELVTSAFRNSYFNPAKYRQHGVALASARAGNVIGGGDWAADRLIPDFFRAIMAGNKVKIRRPDAIRPWQHVLEPLSGYLMLCQKLYTSGPSFAEAWNFGPHDKDVHNVEWIIKTLCTLWDKDTSFEIDSIPHPHESGYLKLNCLKAKSKLGWTPEWDIEFTLRSIVEWNKALINYGDMREVCLSQIKRYFLHE